MRHFMLLVIAILSFVSSPILASEFITSEVHTRVRSDTEYVEGWTTYHSTTSGDWAKVPLTDTLVYDLESCDMIRIQGYVHVNVVGQSSPMARARRVETGIRKAGVQLRVVVSGPAYGDEHYSTMVQNSATWASQSSKVPIYGTIQLQWSPDAEYWVSLQARSVDGTWVDFVGPMDLSVEVLRASDDVGCN